MTVELSTNGMVVLSGDCPHEEAEVLLQHLLAAPGATVDWRDCQTAHTAMIQLLMAARPKLLGPPAGAVLQRWVQPLLAPASA
jgi:hypothetical protein